jgi:nitroreductase
MYALEYRKVSDRRCLIGRLRTSVTKIIEKIATHTGRPTREGSWMADTLSADEVLTTTRAVRRRLDLNRPVPLQLVKECVRIAMHAPSGSNRQDYGFVCVSDPARRAAIAELYNRSIDIAVKKSVVYSDGDVRGPAGDRQRSASLFMRDHLAEVPWIVIPCIERKLTADSDSHDLASLYGSVMPAFWSFMLAARARGLGTVFTTRHLTFEAETAAILNIPYDSVTQVGMTPLAYYTGDSFKPAQRIPVDEIFHLDQW